MARGSWQGLYNDVIDGFMLQRREQELLLLMAIAKFCDPFGFCFPGRINLMRLRRLSQPVYERRIAYLQDCSYITVLETYDYRRRQTQFDFQVNPRVLYVREEVQEYCERVFDAVQERDFAFEKRSLEILFRTNESQPETEPETESETEPASGTRSRTRNHNQLSHRAEKQQGLTTSTMRNAPQTPSAQTTANDAKRTEDNPPTWGAAEFESLRDAPAEIVIKAIMHLVSTTQHQAAEAVRTYPIGAIIHWLMHTAQRRERNELAKPGGYFFKMLKTQVPPIDPPGPNGQ